MSPSIRTAQAAVSRVLSTTDSEKTLVEIQISCRSRSRPRASQPTHIHGPGAGALSASTPKPTTPRTRTRTPGAGARTSALSPTPATSSTKPRIYHTKRTPLHMHTAVGRATTNTTSIFSGAGPLVLPTRRGVRELSYAANLRTLINDAVARNIHEEFEDDEDDERLRTLLAGRVVGGANKFGRVRIGGRRKN